LQDPQETCELLYKFDFRLAQLKLPCGSRRAQSFCFVFLSSNFDYLSQQQLNVLACQRKNQLSRLEKQQCFGRPQETGRGL
jgi:hypothetical protein